MKGRAQSVRAQCEPELAKTKNIVEMAVDFSAMMRVFSKDSK
jgi:hypothetical protein